VGQDECLSGKTASSHLILLYQTKGLISHHIVFHQDGIDSTPTPPASINHELNFSLVDLNMVATSKSPSPMPTHVARPQGSQRPHRHQGESSRRGSPRHQYYRGRGGRPQLQHNQRRPRSVSNASSVQQQLFHQPSGSPQHYVHYPQFTCDESSVYSFHSQQQDQTLSPQHQHSQSYNYPYPHSRQQDVIYEQYRLQQQHEHQLHMLQRQQESQRRMLQQQQFQHQHQQMTEQGVMPSSLMPDLSLDIDDYSVSSPPTLHYTPLSPAIQPNPSHPLPGQFGFQFSSSQIGNVHQGGQQQGAPSYASIISPSSSPRHFGQPGPQPHNYRQDKRNT